MIDQLAFYTRGNIPQTSTDPAIAGVPRHCFSLNPSRDCSDFMELMLPCLHTHICPSGMCR